MPRMKQTSRKSQGLPMKKRQRLLTMVSRKRAPPTGGVKKPHRYRPGTVALREIRRYQTTTDTLIPKRSFQLLVQEVMQNECRLRGIECKRIQSMALLGLQTACEQYVIELFSQTQIAAIHGKRITIQPKDMSLALQFRGDHLKFNK